MVKKYICIYNVCQFILWILQFKLEKISFWLDTIAFNTGMYVKIDIEFHLRNITCDIIFNPRT